MAERPMNTITLRREDATTVIDTDHTPGMSPDQVRLVIAGPHGVLDRHRINLGHTNVRKLRDLLSEILDQMHGGTRELPPIAQAIREFHDAAAEAEAAGMEPGAHLKAGFYERLAAIKATEAAGRRVATHGITDARPRD